MYESIGVNLSKKIDNSTRRVKVPAITQRQYYKDKNQMEFIKLYEDDDFDDEFIEKEQEPTYLDDDYDEDSCYDSCCNFDAKNIALISIGVIGGLVGLYLLAKRR